MREDFPEVIDSTMRGSFRCLRRGFWNYIHEIVPDGENVHLHAGSCFARGLEVTRLSFFRDGKSYPEAILDGGEALLKAWGKFAPAEDEAKQVDRVLGAFEFYHSVFPMPQDRLQPFITPKGPAVEFNFVLPIPGTKHPTTGNPVLYAGRFDMLGRMKDSDVLFVVDEKTTSQLGPTWGNQWTLRAQFSGYVWGARQYGYAVAGATVRGVSILKTTYGNAEQIVYRPPWMIENWLEVLRRDVEEMIAAWREWKETGKLEPWVQDLDSLCSSYGGCGYMRLCDSPTPQNMIPIYYREHKWDPTIRPFLEVK